jgi:hypothetical protein
LIRTAASLALVAAVLGGCSKSAEQPQAAPTPFVKNGWATLWNDAPGTVTLLNRMGFRLGEYVVAGQGFQSEATPTPMGDPSAPPVNMAHLTVSGDQQRLRTMRFSLDLVNAANGAFARQQFGRWIGQPLKQLGAPGTEPVVAAIEAEHPGAGTLAGATYAVTREPLPSGTRWVVTFSRPDAMAGTAEPRKK